MKKIFLSFLMAFAIVSGLRAEALLTMSDGFKLTLTDEGPVTTTADREEKVWIEGAVFNTSGKMQAIRLGVELVNVKSGESFFKKLMNIKEWAANSGLAAYTFYPYFVTVNGEYEVHPIYTTYEQDENLAESWSRVKLPAGFKVPTLKITGAEPVAYLSAKPYVGYADNVTDLQHTKLHISLTTTREVKDVKLYAFVHTMTAEKSIGRYLFTFDQKAGETCEYTAEYVRDGSEPADLKVGETYLLNFRFFVGTKEQEFGPEMYDEVTFRIVSEVTGIESVMNDNAQELELLGVKKVMLPDGRIVVKGRKGNYQISGCR